MRVKKHNRRDGHPHHHHHHHHHHHSRGKTRRNTTTTPSFRAPRLSPSESIAQTTATLRVLKRDGTFDRIRDRLVRSILQNETLKTYAQFAVTASTRIMASRFNNDTTTTGGRRRSDEDGETTTQKPSSVKFDAETKMAVKREVERDLSREVSNAAWQVLAERDGDVPRAIQSEIFRERKMRHEAKERKEEMKKKEKKKKRREGRRPTTLL
tara:strand:- start:857 stop:1489 length:633 start_codon:yes stop_codon:yes gene_type:complete